MFELTGKVIIVTGGTSGIGESTCIEMAKQGAKVAIAGRSIERGTAIEKKINESGGEAIFIQTDITNKDALKALVDKTVSRFGKLNCAVNNAGIVQDHMKLHLIPDELVDKMIDTNFRSVFYGMKYEIPEILKAGGGAIVNVASVAGLRGTPGMVLYNATKAGVIGMTQGAAMDYARKNIRINAVCPGTTMTPIVPPQFKDILTKAIPTGKGGTPEEIAHLIIALCSDEIGNVTGTYIVADNGETTIFGNTNDDD